MKTAEQMLLAELGFAGWSPTDDTVSVKSYADFAAKVPVNSYEELKGDIEKMRLGASDLLWPGKVRYYARSPGSTPYGR